MVITLRRGRELHNSKEVKQQVEVEKKNVENEKEKASVEINQEDMKIDNKEMKQKQDEVVLRRVTFLDNPPIYTPPLPFPQRFRKAKLDEKFSKFLNIFKKLEVNIPFVDALAQMPNYVKFMKAIMSNKKKLDSIGIASLSENCSAIIQRKLP